MASKYTAMTGLSGVVGMTKVAFQPHDITAWDRMQQAHPYASLGAYMLPFVGTGQSLGDMANNISKRRYLAAVGDAGWAALGLLPGAGLLKGIKGGAKGLQAGRAAAQATRAAKVTASTGKTFGGISRLLARLGYHAGDVGRSAGAGISKVLPRGAVNAAGRGSVALDRVIANPVVNYMAHHPMRIGMGAEIGQALLDPAPPTDAPGSADAAPDAAPDTAQAGGGWGAFAQGLSDYTKPVYDAVEPMTREFTRPQPRPSLYPIHNQ